ncbi:T-lymphocyte activation antigen CD80-like [Neolamprologus brichardi]|uniref:T-lymphocyte activation antigen CD80-like n=1 Tax=Neolamprologus brichardi TaxID=32507 RepID=UPI0003EBFA2C|nr:T-lymphocyte activation antigen CD80-like [Neolamprologus brichardi]
MLPKVISVFGLFSSFVVAGDATLMRDVNTTISDSAVLECSIQDRAITDWKSLRFYWQDDRNVVLYSYNNGRKVAEHVNELYQHRVTDFPQDIVRGNITIVLKNLTLDDNGRTYSSFAAVRDDSGTTRYHLEHTQICEMTLHVAVPYQEPRLDVNTEAMSAVCSLQGGFPAPDIQWVLLHNSSHQSVESRNVNTETKQNVHNHLYSSRSILHIPAGRHEAVSCLSHNPTLNRTVKVTHNFNTAGAAARSSPAALTVYLIAAAVVLLTAVQ